MTPRTVNCPRCNTPVAWQPQNLWRPFCSERCKMIDLGAWANEEYRVPETEKRDGGEEERPTAPE